MKITIRRRIMEQLLTTSKPWNILHDSRRMAKRSEAAETMLRTWRSKVNLSLNVAPRILKASWSVTRVLPLNKSPKQVSDVRDLLAVISIDLDGFSDTFHELHQSTIRLRSRFSTWVVSGREDGVGHIPSKQGYVIGIADNIALKPIKQIYGI